MNLLWLSHCYVIFIVSPIYTIYTVFIYLSCTIEICIQTLDIVEGLITNSGFIAAQATPGDIVAAGFFDILSLLDPEFANGYPKLSALYKKALEKEAVKAFSDATPYPYFKRKSD